TLASAARGLWINTVAAAAHGRAEGSGAMKGDGLGPWRALRGTICVFVALYLIAPLILVVIISFNASPFLQFPPPGLSLRWYRNLFSDPSWTNSLWVSIEVLIPSA